MYRILTQYVCTVQSSLVYYMVSTQYIVAIIVMVMYFLATNTVILRRNVGNQQICRIERICP